MILIVPPQVRFDHPITGSLKEKEKVSLGDGGALRELLPGFGGRRRGKRREEKEGRGRDTRSRSRRRRGRIRKGSGSAIEWWSVPYSPNPPEGSYHVWSIGKGGMHLKYGSFFA